MKVVGVGGGGGNAVNRMIEEQLDGVEFISVNTDAQALAHLQVRRQDPDRQEAHARTRRRRAARDRPPGHRGESRRGRARRSRAPTWSSSPAAWAAAPAPARRPIIAQLAREAGALTVGIVTKPFLFEGRKRMRQAEQGIAEMRKNVDTMIVVPNERLLAVVGKGIPFQDALKKADEVLLHATQGISPASSPSPAS